MATRKRRRSPGSAASAWTVSVSEVAGWVGKARAAVAVSGAGISVASGLSTFTTPASGPRGVGDKGVYARARRMLGGDVEGYGVFKHTVFERRPGEVSRVYEWMRRQVLARGAPTATHRALAALQADGILRRHVTLNVDGLHRRTTGACVEMHGCILESVCTRCGDSRLVDAAVGRAMAAGRQPGLVCAACRSVGTVRHGIMLYGTPDAEAALLLRGVDPVAQLLADVAEADLVLWLGLSFEQSASVDYFCRAHGVASGRAVRHVLVGPQADECFHNLLSAGADVGAGNVFTLSCASDDLLAPFAPPDQDGGPSTKKGERGCQDDETSARGKSARSEDEIEMS